MSSKVTKEDVVEDVREVFERTEGAFTQNKYLEEGEYSEWYLRDRVGVWKEVLDEIGVPLSRRHGRILTDEEIIELMRECASGGVLRNEEFDEQTATSWSTAARRFGTWEEAKEVAGLESPSSRIRNSEIQHDIARVMRKLGHVPTSNGYNEEGVYSSQVVQDRGDGSWREGVQRLGFEPYIPNSQIGGYMCLDCGSEEIYKINGDIVRCNSCQAEFSESESRQAFKEDNEGYQKLSEGPRLPIELPCRRSQVPGEVKALIPKSGTKSHPRAISVIYLPGDTREAIRYFIEENEDYVASCLETRRNPMQYHWDEQIYEMLKEEWEEYV